MILASRLVFFLALFPLADGSLAKEQIMKPHELAYDMTIDFGFSITGIMIQTLKPLPNSRWQLKRKATALGFKAEESSELSYIDGSIRALKYRRYDFGFSNKDDVAFTIKGADTYDLVTLVLRLAQDLNKGINIAEKIYKVQTDSDSFEDYRIQVKGEEIISTPAGRFNTLKIQKIEKQGKETTFWLYPDAGHIIIQGVSENDNGSKVTLTLKKAIIDGITPEGL